jgi:methylenetetrahydrofolate--tRNA-(uracil-5-)-methyltransferase
MPPNFGILPPFSQRIRQKRERYAAYAERSLIDLNFWHNTIKINYLSTVV